jgi:hypothetical protein
MSSMRLNQRLLDMAGVLDKNAKLKAYEEARQAINAKQHLKGRQADVVGGLDIQPETVVSFREQEEVPAWKVNPDEYRNNLKTALKLMYGGGPVAQEDVTHASELVKAAFEKYGSVDPMKMRQLLRYSGDDEEESMLPAKGSR